MLGIKEYNQKINSLKSTQKITSAMKMISAAKLRRIEKQKEVTEPYYSGYVDIVNRFKDFPDYSKKYFLTGFKKVTHAHIVVVTSDRGLCGAFNGNITKRTLQLIEELKNKRCSFSISCIGKRGYEFLKKRQFPIEQYYDSITKEMTMECLTGLVKDLCASYSQEKCQEIWIVRNEFVSALTRNIVAKKILPMTGLLENNRDDEKQELSDEFIIEPDREELTSTLLPKFIKLMLYYALLDSLSSEYSARMTAMDSATRNCVKMIDQYTLLRNRARQAAITTELIEIVAGKEVLQ